MNQSKKLRERLKAGEVTIHAMLRLPDPSIAEIIALSGVDYMTLDNEHFSFNDETIQNIIRAANLHGVGCMVRPCNLTPEYIAKLMDMGAIGILAPQVDSFEEAMQVVNAVKYAPIGKRGFCPISKAASFGIGIDPIEYAKEKNRETIIGLMIESKEGIEDLDRILQIDEIDMIAIGPSDVSNSYGHPGEYNHPEVVNAIAGARQKVIQSGKSLCVQAGNLEKAKMEYETGGKGLLIGSDVQILTAGFENIIKDIKTMLEK